MNKLYASIVNGVVANLLSVDQSIPTTAFPALTLVDLTGISPQPRINWSYTAPATFSPPTLASLSPQAAYAEAIAAGCQITSTGNAANLNGTYAIDNNSTGKIAAIVDGINAGKGLPGGGSTFNLSDINGNLHAVGATDLVNLAAALETYVYDLIMTEASLLGRHGGTWPTQPVTIP